MTGAPGRHPSQVSSQRRARIVCTLGPASSTRERLRALVEAGLDVARLNFSHGSHRDHAELARELRAAAAAVGRTVALLADLQGPKIRLGALDGGSLELEAGAELLLEPKLGPGRAGRAGISYEGLAADVAPGDPILLADGRVRLEVLRIQGDAVLTRVVEGGRVSDRAGVNLPGAGVSLPSLTAKDRADLSFALGLEVDWVALSFVRGPRDAEPVRELMKEVGREVPVLAKIEKPGAVSILEEVTEAFDGLLIARGDLGVELPLERVPGVQLRAIELARSAGKPSIVATQMLDSMIERPRPTRAEVSDVANAVRDGADAVMLSGETSIGEHPVAAVRTMDRIIRTLESESGAASRELASSRDASDAIAASAILLARETRAAALCAFTLSGASARRLARHRPETPIVALSPDPVISRQLKLVWGIRAETASCVLEAEEMLRAAERTLLELDPSLAGERIVVVAGAPVGRPGGTNWIRLHRLGELALGR